MNKIIITVDKMLIDNDIFISGLKKIIFDDIYRKSTKLRYDFNKFYKKYAFHGGKL